MKTAEIAGCTCENACERLLCLNACQVFDARMLERMERAGVALEELATGETLRNILGVTERVQKRFSDLMAGGWGEREMDMCRKRGGYLYSYWDKAYPQSLRELPDPPLLLYVWGDYPLLSGNSVSVVGTRRCTPYGKKVARMIGGDCAGQGAAVVSGGARGIDGAAHEGALDAGGRTLAVLGTGVDRVFPAEHAGLFARIRRAGALVSEYPLGTSGRAWNFPRRNRIIAALSSRLVVVEAPYKSGAMITARQALELGKEVWAVPGRMDESVCSGSNRLIFDGAHPLVSLDVFGGTAEQRFLFDSNTCTASGVGDVDGLDEEDLLLLRLLSEQGDRTVDNLAAGAKMSAAGVLKRMVLLSAKGIVFNSAPGRFSLCSS